MNLLINEINFPAMQLIEIAKKAGALILDIYQKHEYEIEDKPDNTPVTTADKAANDYIVNSLQELLPEITCISEEQTNLHYRERKDKELLFCVDPLDGTSNFIKRNGEFCVNIALLYKNKPVFGIIYVPLMRTLYFGGKEYGAYKQIYVNEIQKINVNNDYFGGIILTVSRNHSYPEDDLALRSLEIIDKVIMGSAIKYGLIAEGKADLYYRSGVTMEWDSAAGQAIVEGAGGYVSDMNGEEMKYNKENLENPPFFCMSSKKIFEKEN